MTQNNSRNAYMTKPGQSPPAHFFIYENLNFVADSKISKEQISIGSSRNADVVLSHSAVADIHAFIHFEGAQAFLTNRYPDNGMHLNGQSVHLAKLHNEDVIDVGPYALKVKMGANGNDLASSGEKRYCVALVNRYKCADDRRDAAVRLARLFKTDADKMAGVIVKPEYVVKKELSQFDAERYQIALQKAGIYCELREMAPAPVKKENAHSSSDQISKSKVEPIIYEDEEDEEDALWQAPFSLKEKLSKIKSARQSAMRTKSQLQVVKTAGDQVLDVLFLNKGQKYSVPTVDGSHCLARRRGESSDFVYFNRDFSGYIKNSKGETTADLNSSKTSDYLYHKRRRLYRIEVPDTGEVVLCEGPNQYRVFKAAVAPSPTVSVPIQPSEFSWRHWAFSAATHLFFALGISIYWYLQIELPKAPGPHFVKIDPALMQQLQPKKIPDRPKAPPPKPEPQKLVKKVEPLKKAPPKKRPPKKVRPSKTKKHLKQTAKAAPPSRHPKAGGGFGKGNIRNRNINQAGLLSVLGQAPAAGQSATIASVTNLDAVAVPGATENNFTVGGVKGSLGNGKIAVAGGKMLQTKGSKLVLRSAGVGGSGHVAALEKGNTGNKQVQGMVTAKMSRTVKIRGGMSREMVKRVIDQHLSEISYCYETALMSNPAIMGRIVFEWKILMTGRVGQVRIVASSINSHEVHNCIKAAIQTWQFPKPVGTEVVVSYPFVFDLVAF